jgi:hypothetical protein
LFPPASAGLLGAMRLAPETFAPDAIWWIGAIAAAVVVLFIVLAAARKRPPRSPDGES